MDFTGFFYADIFSFPLKNMHISNAKSVLWSKRPAVPLVRRDVNIMRLISFITFFKT